MSILRAFKIVWIVASCSISCGIAGLMGALQQDRRATHQRIGRSLASAAIRLGPVGIKLGQLLSARADLLPVPVVQALSPLQDNVSYIDFSTARDRIDQVIKEEPRSRLRSLDTTPIAGGSIAYVFRGELISGEPVAIKVVRRGVRDAIALDVRLLRILLRVSVILAPSLRPMAERVAEGLFTSLLSQCDMRKEAVNADRLLHNSSSSVRIPRSFPGFTTEDVVAFEFLDSRPISSCTDDELYRELSMTLLRETFGMVFVHGVVHTDMHPGNVRIDQAGRLVLLDFGLMTTISYIDRRRFRRFFFGLVTQDSRLVAELLTELGHVDLPSARFANFENEVASILSQYSHRPVGEFLVVGLVRQLFELQRNWRILADPGFVQAVWALTLVEGLIRARLPKLNFQSVALEYLMKPYANVPA